MNKQRFILIVILLIVINVVLFNYYLKTKQTMLEENYNLKKLETKILNIKYIQKKLKNNININECKKYHNNNNLVLECKIKPRRFRYISRKIFNSNIEITKFIIENKKDYIYIKVEIPQ